MLALAGKSVSVPVGQGLEPAPEARAAQALLQECAALLASLPTLVYTAPSRLLPGGTVGKHIRHLLDHVQAAADAMGAADQVIDYDHRERETALESNVLVAIGMIDRLARHLGTMEASIADWPVRVRAMLSADGEHVTRASSLGREIAFAVHHALHHQAMIAAICREHGVAVDGAFGMAPATAAHEATKACRCGS
jgi:hypothetical protein